MSGTHLGPAANFSHSLFDYFFRQFRVCCCGASSLTRSRVCTFSLCRALPAAILRSESHGNHEHILLSLFLRLLQPGAPGSCIYFSQEQDSPVILPGIESCRCQKWKLQCCDWILGTLNFCLHVIKMIFVFLYFAPVFPYTRLILSEIFMCSTIFISTCMCRPQFEYKVSLHT
jgi:hypothetical protein